MSLNESVAAAVTKKTALLDQSPSRFIVRAILAGVYLLIGTAFAGAVAQAVEKNFEGLGSVAFAFLFGLGLFAIIILGADLATGNMMFMVYGAANKQVTWAKAFWLIIVTTVFNLVGAAILVAALGVSAKFGNLPVDHIIVTLTDAKLAKGPAGMLVEGILANFVVNMSIVGGIFAKEIISKFIVIVPLIAAFVGMGLEHVIANFCLVCLTFFDAGAFPEHFTLGAVLTNWAIVWVGNVIGGGFLIGGVYAWLNKGPEAYRD
ncbi:formate/nitrite transporter family protein [Corynebacterium macginleyi]|uniref:formate/nitrite transporter family protein n=1 Tax=Corynebacterium macginleyi TaxID=38290 RepID=UPI00190DE98E|nr:formate/nitrite transporter family protein [Corynebacterium macginleyi]MBK4147980.1 formate/nitrite transporter family protein [Corynebacterium macginleyi]MBK4179026.1 formate/nitrite transporter family protein [Corynebacterium macginleyi]